MKISHCGLATAAWLLHNGSARAGCDITLASSSSYSSLTAGSLTTYVPATYIGGPDTNGAGTAAAVNNEELIQGAINYANEYVFISNNSATFKICLPAGLYFLSPYFESQTITVNGMSVVLPEQPTKSEPSESGPGTVTRVLGDIDISAAPIPAEFPSTSFGPLYHLTASATGNLTIAGSGDCVDNGAAVQNCTSGTELYTDNPDVTIYGDQSNHVTFSRLAFNKPQVTVSQGTVTATAPPSGSGLYYTPASVTLNISAGFPDAATLFNRGVNYIELNGGAPESRYLRSYSAPSGSPGGAPELLPTTDTFNNKQNEWGEPSAMQTEGACVSNSLTVYGSSAGGTFQCQVAPVCSGTNPVSCTIYTNSATYAPPYSTAAGQPGNFVCIKAKTLEGGAYNLQGPFKDGTSGSSAGGDDVMFSNVAWFQEGLGRTSFGFKNFTVNGMFVVRAPKPFGATETPCLSNTGGGLSIEPFVQDNTSYTTLGWSPGTTTILAFGATGTGDDAIAVFPSEETVVLGNVNVSDSFARGLFLNDAGTLITNNNCTPTGTSILATWTTSGDTTSIMGTSTFGTQTFTRDPYEIINYTLPLSCGGGIVPDTILALPQF